jgi:hypothetical protein
MTGNQDTVIFINYYQSDEMRKDNKGGICSMHIRHEKCVQNIHQKTDLGYQGFYGKTS